MAVGSIGSLASASQTNFQVKADSASQAAQGAKKPAKAAQTDTVSISVEALKKADDRSAVAKEEAKKAEQQKALQLAGDRAAAAKDATTQASQNNAMKAYAAVGASR